MERTKPWTLSETEGLNLSLCASDSSMVKNVLFPDLFFPLVLVNRQKGLLHYVQRNLT